MHADRTFPGSAVLPPTPEGAALARFLILSRQADHLHAALAGRSGDGSVLTLEARLVLLGCYIGSIKELADAFRDMKSQGYLTWVDGHRDALPDLASDLATAEGGTDKTNPSSLYCTLLKRVRDTAGFHVQRGLVHDILRMIKDLPVKAANVTGPEQAVLSMPVVEFLMAFLIWSDGRDEKELAATMAAAVALQSALRNVAHDLYFLRVRFATELPRG